MTRPEISEKSKLEALIRRRNAIDAVLRALEDYQSWYRKHYPRTDRAEAGCRPVCSPRRSRSWAPRRG